MKKNIFVSFTLAATFFVNAQQKNTLLEQSFWKTAPDVAAVQAEIAKGNSPSALNPNAFDATVMAINNDAPVATIKFLLEQPGNEISKSTHDSRVYLHWASYRGNVEIADYLIKKGSELNVEDSKGETPLTFAAVSGQTNTALYDLFFKVGINPKKKYKNGANLLLMAIPSDKDLALSTYFTSKGMSLKDTDNDGNTAFNYAARSGNVPFLKSLLEKGIKYTDNALIFAAQGSRRESNTLETYQYLVEDLKIKPTTMTNSGETVLHLLASKPNQTEIIRYFISKGADVNKADNEGNTPLMIAASARDMEALQLLLPIAKNINLKNIKGESALTMAIKSGSPEMATLLLEKGADAKILDKDGNNLGFYLVQSYRPQAGMARGQETNNALKEDPFAAKIKLLQDKGIDLSSPQKDGNTLYNIAVVKNDMVLLQKMANLNIDINAKNKDGLTALHKAAMISKDDVIIKYLLSIGAKKEINTDFGESPYDLAKENETFTKKKTDLEFLK
jgi:ankyrin repeat protein